MISGASEEELELANVIADKLLLQKENQELKKQLEDKEDFISKLQASKDKLNKWNYEDAMKQKEFIKYLEKRYKDVTSVIGSFGSNTDLLYGKKDMIEEILQKHKEIMGSNDEEEILLNEDEILNC